jgi:transcriptional regulator GlxA family with amidase domain
MGNPEALLRCAALVEERLREPLTVQEMAEAARWSLYHFCRVFSEAMSMGPHDYLVRRRITEAARELAASERRITDLAFE